MWAGLCLGLLLCFCTPAYTKSKNVTKKYKKTVEKLLRPFDGFLYQAELSSNFKFDDYARTSMLMSITKESTFTSPSQAFSRIKPSWGKTLYGKFNPKLVNSSSYNAGIQLISETGNCAFLFQVIDGKTRYLGGNPDDWRVGKIKKIIKKNKNTFVATYNLYEQWPDDRSVHGLRSSFKVTLKKKGKTFRISKIKKLQIK